MQVTVTGKLNKAANEFQAGESIGFGFRLGVQVYNRKTKEREWVNYSAVAFARAAKQIDFYRQSLIPEAIVEVSGDGILLEEYNGNMTLDIQNAHIGFINSPMTQSVPQSAAMPNGGIEDDIPFS